MRARTIYPTGRRVKYTQTAEGAAHLGVVVCIPLGDSPPLVHGGAIRLEEGQASARTCDVDSHLRANMRASVFCVYTCVYRHLIDFAVAVVQKARLIKPGARGARNRR